MSMSVSYGFQDWWSSIRATYWTIKGVYFICLVQQKLGTFKMNMSFTIIARNALLFIETTLATNARCHLVSLYASRAHVRTINFMINAISQLKQYYELSIDCNKIITIISDGYHTDQMRIWDCWFNAVTLQEHSARFVNLLISTISRWRVRIFSPRSMCSPSKRHLVAYGEHSWRGWLKTSPTDWHCVSLSLSLFAWCCVNTWSTWHLYNSIITYHHRCDILYYIHYAWWWFEWCLCNDMFTLFSLLLLEINFFFYSLI